MRAECVRSRLTACAEASLSGPAAGGRAIAAQCRAARSRASRSSRSRRASDSTCEREWEWECRRGAPHPRTEKTRTPQAQSAERRKRARRAGATEPEASAVEGRARGSRRLAALSVRHSPSPRVVSSMAHGVAWGVFASRHGTRQRGTARPHERDPTAVPAPNRPATSALAALCEPLWLWLWLAQRPARMVRRASCRRRAAGGARAVRSRPNSNAQWMVLGRDTALL